MNKFTKYAIYFLVGILAYYLLFNNGSVEGFDNTSLENYKFTVPVTSGTAAQDVTLNQKIASSVTSIIQPPPRFSATVENGGKKHTLCQKLLNSITTDTVSEAKNTSIFYKNTETESGFTYVMLNYTKPTWFVTGTCTLDLQTEEACHNASGQFTPGSPSTGTCAGGDREYTYAECLNAGGYPGDSEEVAVFDPEVAVNCAIDGIASPETPKVCLNSGGIYTTAADSGILIRSETNGSCTWVGDSYTDEICPGIFLSTQDPTSTCTLEDSQTAETCRSASGQFSQDTGLMGTCMGVDQLTLENECGDPKLNTGVYILKYPTSLDTTDTTGDLALDALTTAINSIEIYYTELETELETPAAPQFKKFDGSDFATTATATLTNTTVSNTCGTFTCSGTLPVNKGSTTPCANGSCTKADCCEPASDIPPPGARPPPIDPCPGLPALIPGASSRGNCTVNMANNGICIQLMTDGECTPTRCTNGVHHLGACTKYKDYTCTNGLASSDSSESIDDEEKCDPTGCDPGFWYSTGDKKCHIISTCAGSVGLCETGESLNASATCNKAACDKDDCCVDNYSIEIGITVGIIICICLIIGIFYVFSSRSRHKAAHKVLSGKDGYIYK